MIEADEVVECILRGRQEERRLFYVALTRASRGAYLITNSRQPSRYIRELCEIAGDEIRFETIEGAARRQCPKCLVGQMIEKRNRNGATFCGCNQFPDCKHAEGATRPLTVRARRRA